MSSLESESRQPQKLLIITSSGGGGLLQVAAAKEQQIQTETPHWTIIRRDLLKDWTGKRMGGFFANFWNRAQRRGDLKAQWLCVEGQFLVDFFIWPKVFFWALRTLFKEDVDRVIDTQPMGTSAILKAIRIFNRKRGKHIHLEKVLVDLPTKKATHFFRPIKKLSPKDRALIRLVSIPPLLEQGETAEEFWRANCNLSEKEISYEDFAVRRAFRKLQGKSRPLEPIEVCLSYKSRKECEWMQKTYRRGAIQAKALDQGISFLIAPEDRVMTLLLGSQPANDATLTYVKKFVQVAKEPALPKVRTHFFVFASNDEGEGASLFQKIAEFVLRVKGYPSHFSVIPFSFQSDEGIAPLFFRSDLTCTRSGGSTAMELMCVSSGELWIHSEAKKSPGRELTLEELLKGIPGWEAENAVYLQKVRGAKVVTPETITPLARRFFQSNGRGALPTSALQSAG